MKCCDSDKPEIISVGDDSLEGLICYCFQHSKKELFKAIKNGSEQNIVNDIKTKIKNLGCFCETSNPSGKCCLSDIFSFIKNFNNLKS